MSQGMKGYANHRQKVFSQEIQVIRDNSRVECYNDFFKISKFSKLITPLY